MAADTATSSVRQQLIAEVQSLGERDSLAVLPRLAAIDRVARGYLTLLVSWMLGCSVSAGLLLMVGAAATGALLVTSLVGHVFLEQASVVPAQSYLLEAVATFLTAALLIRRFLAETGAPLFQHLSPPRGVMIILYPLRLLVIWVATGRQFMMWFPLAVLVLLGAQVCVVRVVYYLAAPQEVLATLSPWQVSLPLLLISGLIIWSIGRRQPLRLIVMLILVLAAIGGVRGMAAIIPFLGVVNQETVALAAVAVLGLVVLLRPMALLCYNKLIGVNIWTIELFQLRLALRHALQTQRRRNRALVGTRSAWALCTACIARIEQVREPISYHRQFICARCTLCGTDQHCTPNITDVEGVVNSPQPTDIAHSPAKVRGRHAEVDLNGYLARKDSLPKALTAVLFLKASSRDIETFLLRYEIQERDRQITPRRNFICTLTGEAMVSKSLLAKLGKVFGHNLHVEQASLRQTEDITL